MLELVRLTVPDCIQMRCPVRLEELRLILLLEMKMASFVVTMAYEDKLMVIALTYTANSRLSDPD
jgi:hypothetical protein